MAIKGAIMFKDFDGKATELYFKGWEIKNIRVLVEEVLEEQINPDEEIIIINIDTSEIAFSCSRYFEGEDAGDEGYSYWFNWHNNWKKGLGKCTLAKIHWDKQDAKCTLNEEVKG